MASVIGITAGLLTTGIFLKAAQAAVKRKQGKGLTKKFDATFFRHCGRIPVPYLRALAKKESGFDARDQQGPAWGLLQVTEVLRRDFNDRHGTDFARDDLLDPSVNVRIACDLLNRIVRFYSRNHRRAFAGGFDFANRRHVELLTFGWNAGFSERSGTGFVIGELESIGIPPGQIDADAVHAFALDDPRAVRFLRIARRLRFSKAVTVLYFQERRRSKA